MKNLKYIEALLRVCTYNGDQLIDRKDVLQIIDVVIRVLSNVDSRSSLNLVKQGVNVLKYNDCYIERLNVLKNKKIISYLKSEKIIREEGFFFMKS